MNKGHTKSYKVILFHNLISVQTLCGVQGRSPGGGCGGGGLSPLQKKIKFFFVGNTAIVYIDLGGYINTIVKYQVK